MFEDPESERVVMGSGGSMKGAAILEEDAVASGATEGRARLAGGVP